MGIDNENGQETQRATSCRIIISVRFEKKEQIDDDFFLRLSMNRRHNGCILYTHQGAPPVYPLNPRPSSLTSTPGQNHRTIQHPSTQTISLPSSDKHTIPMSRGRVTRSAVVVIHHLTERVLLGNFQYARDMRGRVGGG